jgi:hypothetical protein
MKLYLFAPLAALLAACTPTPTGNEAPGPSPDTEVESAAEPSTAESDADQAKALLALGLARLHTGDNEQAATAFSTLRALAPDSPTATYNLALAQYRGADLGSAKQTLGSLAATSPPVRAAVGRLQARLAYEDGDAEAEQAALRAALDADPADIGAAWALSRSTRDDTLRLSLLTQAHLVAPQNAPIAAEYGLLAAESDSAEERSRGEAALKGLLELSEHPDTLALLKARSLNAYVNLIRSSTGYRADGEELEKRLAPAPLNDLVAWRFRTRQAFVAPLLELRSAALEDASPYIAAAWVGDAGEGDLPVAPPDLATLDASGVTVGPSTGTRTGRVAVAGGVALAAMAIDIDPQTELVVLRTEGLTVLDRTQDWAATELPGADLRWMLPVDIEHDGDADLLLGNANGELLVSRNVEGLNAPRPADLPTRGPVLAASAVDMDGDGDTDLVLGRDGQIDVLLNDRLGDWSVSATLPSPGKPIALRPLDHRGEGILGVAVLTDLGIAILRGGAIPSIDPVATGTLTPIADLLAPSDFAVTDLDLDGDPDLVFTGAPRGASTAGIVLAENLGGGLFRVDGAATSAPLPAQSGLLVGQFDTDPAPDVLVWSREGSHKLSNVSTADRAVLDLDLRAPPTKAPSDARGVRIDVVRAGQTQSFEATGPWVRLSGAKRPDFVTATWPNGITEYLFAPEPGRLHRIELVVVLEGSCPFLYAWDGERYRFITDLLGVSPLGIQLAPGVYAPADADEYLRLPDWIANDGSVRLRFTEELHEVIYLDALELIAVDAPADMLAQSGEKWTMPPVKGFDLRFSGTPVPPLAARDGQGDDALDRIRALDHVYVNPRDSHPRYQGTGRAVLELTAPPEIASSKSPLLILTGWLHWGTTSTNIALSQIPDFRPAFPSLEVGDGAGGWRSIEAVSPGLPAGKTKPVLVDLSGVLEPSDPRIRISGDFAVAWDQAAFAVATPTDDVSHLITSMKPSVANLEFGGFSKMTRVNEDAPHEFDYSERRPWPWRVSADGTEFPIGWHELHGMRTAYGPVGGLLETVDDTMVVFGTGEEIALEFDTSTLPPLADGHRRTLFLFSHGWDKDGDPNVAWGQTVLPLPFNAMEGYPYEGAYPDTEALRAFRAETLTRHVPRDRLTALLRSEGARR